MTADETLTDEQLRELLRAKSKPASVIVKELKANGQDHEFYPTTAEIIRKFIGDMELKNGPRRYREAFNSLMDIGAGNGKVLMAAKDHCIKTGRDGLNISEYFAIEKSTILCQQLDPSILIVGTEFHEQNLFSKPVDIIFCNPPYSEFEAWAEKIIKQGSCQYAYLVIPERWEDSVLITDALKWREASAEKIGEFSFEDAEDRAARAKVHLLRVEMPEDIGKEDAFAKFFATEFAGLYEKFGWKEGKAPDKDDKPEDQQPQKEKDAFEKLMPGPNYPEALVALYDAEMAHVRENYRLVSELDANLLREFDMCPARIMGCLKARLKGLKNVFWQELFNRLDKITNRLTSKSRKALLEKLSKHTEVDFTISNILAVVIWVINNANHYLEQQLIETYEHMVDKCNVVLYKSNKRVWRDDEWRYYRGDEGSKPSHYKLDYRIVTHRMGGVSCGYGSEYCLSDNGAEFLGDLMTIANNLGFRTRDLDRPKVGYKSCPWEPGERREFHIGALADKKLLMDVRAFKNANIHIRFNQEFICALNVEHGRLKGWLRTPAEAAVELDDPKAAQYFKRNTLIELNPRLMLTA